MLKQHSQRLERVWEGGFKSEASKAAQALFQSKAGRFLSFLAREQFCHSGTLEPCQHTASAACWGMGEERGNVWAAGFCHKAFSLKEAYNEFPRHDIRQCFKVINRIKISKV